MMTDDVMPLRALTRGWPVCLLGALLLMPSPGAGSDAEKEERGPDSTGAPEVTLEPTSLDLGVVPRAERASGTLTIQNRGSDPIEVTDVSGAAGLEVERFVGSVGAGESRDIEVVLDASKVNGEVILPVTVEVAGHSAPLRSGVRAEIKNFLGATPPHARWIYVQGEEQGTIHHTVWSNDGEDFEILDVTSPHPDLEVDFRKAREDEKRADRPDPQWVVESTLDQWARVGPISGTVEVRTTHPVQERLLLPVSGFVRPILAATPEGGSFGEVDVTEPVERYFHIQAFSTDPVSIESVRLTPETDGVKTRLEVLESGREYTVWVTLLPDAPRGLYEGVVQVRTDDDRVPVLEIPVTAEVL